jgi:hypothetical protein
LNAVVPTGAKYHWHIVPPMTNSLVSSATEMNQMPDTIAIVR